MNQEFEIKSKLNTDKCLMANEYFKVVLWDCNGMPQQKWKWDNVYLINMNNLTLVLDFDWGDYYKAYLTTRQDTVESQRFFVYQDEVIRTEYKGWALDVFKSDTGNGAIVGGFPLHDINDIGDNQKWVFTPSVRDQRAGLGN